jgi:aspartate aminotransferase
MRRQFDERRKRIVSGLNAIPGVTCVEPKGAFYALPNVSEFYGKEIKGRKVSGSLEFAQVCLEEAEIAIVPGVAFGDDRFVRFSYAADLDSINEGLKRFADLLQA